MAISLGALVYWWNRRGFKAVALSMSFLAYFLAIVLKEVLQLYTYGAVKSAFGYVSLEMGLYFGLQTVFLEVGLAYVFAVYAVRSRGMSAQDRVAYGLGLSFWENGILLGLLPLFDLGVIYLVLSAGGQNATTVAAALPSAYFAGPFAAIQAVAIGTLERISSMLAHLAWGILTVASAATGRKKYLAAALPMGLLDALAPFAGGNIDLFEAVVFAFSVCFILLAYRLTRGLRPSPVEGEPARLPNRTESPSGFNAQTEG